MQGAAKRTVIGTRTVLIRVHILKLLLTAHGGPESGCFKLEINEDLCLAPERGEFFFRFSFRVEENQKISLTLDF